MKQNEQKTNQSIFVVDSDKISIAKNNNKLGNIWNLSLLPGNEQNTIKHNNINVVNVLGTCTKHCACCFSNCYAKKSACRWWKNVPISWAKNTNALYNGTLKNQIITKLQNATKKPKYFRINTSGELTNVNDILMWCNISEMIPQINFGMYTKAYEIIDDFIQKYGFETIPTNLVINISQWHNVADSFLNKYPNKFNVFTYDDGTQKGLEKMPHCQAVNKDGTRTNKNCFDCGMCYHNHKKQICVYAH